MIKGVIFDLDGVLTFTDKYHYLDWKELSDKEGIYFDEVINNRLRGVSRMESLDIVLERANKEYSNEEKIQMATFKNDVYVKLLDNITPKDVSEDTRAILTKLKELGIKLAVGSSSKNTIKILKNTDLLKYFDEIADGTMISHSKPDPEVFLLAAKKLGLDSNCCLVIEDAIAGIKAGNNGGFKTCGIGEAASYDKTTYPINSLSDILNHLGEDEMETKIKLEHIKKIYPNGVCAVKDFSLDIYDGEFVVFVGPSGCGKSTVLRMIAGLEEITDGDLSIEGKIVNEDEPKERDIAMVFQNYALYPHLTVRKNIGFPLLMQNVPFSKFFNFKYRKQRKADIYKLVDEVASKIGLSEYLDRKPKNLSGGQRQRVALGRAIIRNPKAFLLDEPLSNLDAKMRAEMRTEISKLHNSLKTIFIYVTHDQVEAMTMGSKIVVMRDGYIMQVGTPDEVFANPANKFVAGFIGTPQMNFINGKLSKVNEELYIEVFDGNKLLINKEVAKHLNQDYIDKEVILGVRPKAISVSDEGIDVDVTISEQLGDEALVYFKHHSSDTEYVSSMQTYNHYLANSKVKIQIDLAHASFFDKETEESILK